MTGAHWRVAPDSDGVDLEPERSRVIVYTLDGGRYEVARDASGALQAAMDEVTFVHNPEWDRGYEAGFADGANNANPLSNGDVCSVIEAGEQALYWLREERDSKEPGATIPDDIIRVLQTALAPFADSESVRRDRLRTPEPIKELIEAARDALAQGFDGTRFARLRQAVSDLESGQ
ncbi:MAG: hypothetical protein ACREEB_11385 [Caulobacteraceae bacterium]